MKKVYLVGLLIVTLFKFITPIRAQVVGLEINAYNNQLMHRTVFNGDLYCYGAYNLWKYSTATSSGTGIVNAQSVIDLISSDQKRPAVLDDDPFTIFNNKLYWYSHLGYLTQMDIGTSTATAIKQIGFSLNSSWKCKPKMCAADNLLFTSGSDKLRTLWKSDGTSSGTDTVKTFSNSIRELIPFGSKVLILTYNTLGPEPVAELWVSDGTHNGTVLLKNYVSTYEMLDGTNEVVRASILRNSSFLNSNFYFTAGDGVTSGRDLYKTDGTPGGTVLAYDFGYAASIDQVQTDGNYLFIVSPANSLSMGFVFRYDGATLTPIAGGQHEFTANSQMHIAGQYCYVIEKPIASDSFSIFRLETGSVSSSLVADSITNVQSDFLPTNIGNHGDTLYFFKGETIAGLVYVQPWRCGGTAASTIKLPLAADCDKLKADNFVNGKSNYSIITTVFNNEVFFPGEIVQNFLTKPWIFKFGTPTTTTASVESLDESAWTIRLFPNPASNLVEITDIPVHSTVSVVDPYGRKIYLTESLQNKQDINVSGWTEGIYFVQVVHQGEATGRRLVITR